MNGRGRKESRTDEEGLARRGDGYSGAEVGEGAALIDHEASRHVPDANLKKRLRSKGTKRDGKGVGSSGNKRVLLRRHRKERSIK